MGYTGKQVIATIHQPSSEIFNMLDQLCILAKGHCVYFGGAKEVVQYFSSLGYECPAYNNPADYVIQQVQNNPQFFIRKWKSVYELQVPINMGSYGTMRPVAKREAGLCTQLSCVLMREMTVMVRDPRVLRIQVAQTVLMAALGGLCICVFLMC